MLNEEFENSVVRSEKTTDSVLTKCLSTQNGPDPIDYSANEKLPEHHKKESLVTKFLQRLSKPDLLSKHKKTSKSKSKNKPPSDLHQSPDDKLQPNDENMNHHTGRSKNIRKMFKRFGKRKSKHDELFESSSCIGSRPSMCSTVITATIVGSCNDVTNDKICREEFEKYNSSSVDCILDYHVNKLLKKQEQDSVSSTSLDFKEPEQRLNSSNTQLVSIFQKETTDINISPIKSIEVAENFTSTTMSTEEMKISTTPEAETPDIRDKESSCALDITLRKSSRPKDIQLRRSRVTSQTSMARSSLIMLAVSHNSPRTKVTSNNVGTPILNQDSPNYPSKKIDFEEECKSIVEEKSEKQVTERNGNDFLKIANQYEIEINGKIEIVQRYMETSVDDMNDDVIGELNTAIGLAKLLLCEKFVQFRGLCEQNLNESDDNGFKTLCCDLEGYLTTLEIQMADLDKHFQGVERIRDNKWQLPVTKDTIGITNGVKKKRAKTKAPHSNSGDAQRSLAAKKRLAEYKRMCAASSQISTNLFIVE